MDVKLDINYCLSEYIGEEHGLSPDDIKGFSGKTKQVHADLAVKRENGKLPFFNLPYQEKEVNDIKTFADEVSCRFDNFVVLGIGGSALGTTALKTALCHPLYNLVTPGTRNNRPGIFILDNIDPNTIKSVLCHLDLKKTCINVISKSGTTAETSSQFMVFFSELKKVMGKDFANNIVATTDASKGILRSITNEYGFKNFIIPDGVGGRFSVFTPVGLFPAAVAGINLGELLAGAARMDERCSRDDLMVNPAYLNAVIHYLMDTHKNKNISVMLPYSDSLYYIADWYRQLWAESLGKKMSLTGKIVHTGQTPVKALGVTDQHSQNQLYVEGPNDKIFTFLTVEDYGSSVKIPEEFSDYGDISYLSGHSLNELITAEQKATEFTLTKNQRPNCSFIFPEVTPFTVGQILFCLEVQTAFAGGLYNINPFDQPGVEEGKHFAYGMLGRKGYEYKQKEFMSSPPKNKEFIL